MFVALYQIVVKPNREEEFRKHWHAITEVIRSDKGSLGSRLHQSEDGSWIAYAQWPSKEKWEEPWDAPKCIEPDRQRMRDCCEKIETIHKLVVVDDLLVSGPPSAPPRKSAEDRKRG